jgi:hypothetical protein
VTLSGALSHSGTSGNFTWGHLTIYGAGSNGGINSLLIGDDVTIGDCNLGGIMGMKSTGANCGFKFFNSSGTAIGVLQSTAGTLQFDGQNIIHSGNISSQSVSYATSAGSVSSITKAQVTAALGYTPPTTNSTYNFSGVSFTSGQSSTAEHNCNNITSNGVWYYTSNGPATSLGASTTDGALYSQAYSTSWVGQIAQDYRNGRLFVRGKNNNSWQSWLRVALYSEIPSTISWSNVTGKPSTFTPASHSHSEYYSSGSNPTFGYIYTTGPLYVGCNGFSPTGNWNEGIRLYGTSTNGTWSKIDFGCTVGSITGSHTNQWSIGRNTNNQFIFGHGTDSENPVLKFNTDNTATFKTSVYTNSDKNLKKNISSIPESSLEALFDISDKLFKSFTWKQSGKASYGFIAQQLEQYIPEAINYNQDQKLSVSYDIAFSKLLAAVIHEIKELKKKSHS